MCSRCGAEPDTHDYPVGNGTTRVGDACWEELTGRPYRDVSLGMAGRGPSRFSEQIAEMQRRKEKIAENSRERWEAAQAIRARLTPGEA